MPNHLIFFMKKILLLLTVIFFCGAIYGQKTITGIVTDDSGEVLIGASISVEDTKYSTVSDIDGSYSIDVPEETKFLTFSYTGYATEKVKIKDRTTISPKLDGTMCRFGWSRQQAAYGQGATTIIFNWDGSKTITTYTPKENRD